MKRLFIHLSDFEKNWKKAKLSEVDLLEFQNQLLSEPKAGNVIKGTNGIRKIRWSKPGRGKSSGVRIFYLDIEEFEIIYLITLIQKNDSDNLSKSELNILSNLVIKLKEAIKISRKK